jgi:hypothetical protein
MTSASASATLAFILHGKRRPAYGQPISREEGRFRDSETIYKCAVLRTKVSNGQADANLLDLAMPAADAGIVHA